jgi:hypothetical protein
MKDKEAQPTNRTEESDMKKHQLSVLAEVLAGHQRAQTSQRTVNIPNL